MEIRMRTRWFLIFVLGGLFTVTGRAQRPTPPAAGQKPAFEVASIKRNLSGSAGSGMSAFPGGRVRVSNLTISNLIANNYSMRSFLIINAPDWVFRDRFDIDAKAPSDAPISGPLLQQMLRQLMADRFKLVMHVETREMPIYHMVMARPGRQLGPKLKPSSVDCGQLAKDAIAAGKPITNSSNPDCMNRGGGPGFIAYGSQGIGLLASLVGEAIGRKVEDRTGLTGNFTLELTYTPDQVGTTPPPDALSVFTALEEQLGLKLRPARGRGEVMVIDSVERPTEN
jgi:uncharacterized protein (TIGR03435 family)